MGRDLRAGDVLSYSAGTTQTGPDGYRYLRRAGQSTGADMLGAVAGRWPELIALLGERPPLVVNGYPAATGDYRFGVQVDSYVNVRVALRALRLARAEQLCAVVIAQPLWLGELIVRAEEGGAVLPPQLIAATGGYPLPQSLERCLVDACEAVGTTLSIVQLFGVAELDAGCLIGRERDATGRTVFHPRDDIALSVSDEGMLLLSRREVDGGWSAPVSTDDRCQLAGADLADGVVILEGTRVLAEPAALIESWDADGWRRRTGYLRRGSDGLVAQLRSGVLDPSPEGEHPIGWHEEEHHEFARHTSASYLTKPDWRCT